MYLYGASGHAKVVLDIIRDQKIEIHGLFDDDSSVHALQGIPVIKTIDGLLEAPIIISVGDNKHRAKLASKLGKLQIEYGTVIHSSAVISKTATVGFGSVVTQGSIIQAEAVIGNHVIINTGASVDHDCLIKDFVSISPHATLCGSVKVGEGTHICAGAVVIPNIVIGKWCVIAAGAVVIRDVPDYAVVAGIPGKIIKYSEFGPLM
jgi:sugar O-acyltransferase (sialic acid O-acetyltransferase NeuD family)